MSYRCEEYNCLRSNENIYSVTIYFQEIAGLTTYRRSLELSIPQTFLLPILHKYLSLNA